jgi:hypothetical protein
MVHEVRTVLHKVKWMETPGSNVFLPSDPGRQCILCVCWFSEVIYCRMEFVRKKFGVWGLNIYVMWHDIATANSDLQLRILLRWVQYYELCSLTCHWRVTQLLTFLCSIDDSCCGDIVSEYIRASDTSPSHPPPPKKNFGRGWVNVKANIGPSSFSPFIPKIGHFVSSSIAAWTSKHLVLYVCVAV